ncbi:MAG: T9SS type A sorting domain-containing protein [Bacteroidota bacterium]
MKKIIIGILFSFSVSLGYAQPANDNCSGATVSPQDGTCIGGTTVAATDSWSGAVGCQTTASAPDVWYTFTATGTQAVFNVTNGTMTGNVEIILVFPNCSSNNCTCPFILEGTDCGPSPNAATFTNLVVGQVYYYTISSSTGSQGTFTACLTVTNPPPAPGQDCVTSQTLCDGPDFSVPLMSLGDGAVEENVAGAWSSCIGDETSSQWYRFTAGTTGTYSLLVEPNTWTPPGTGDDYDWEFYNITTSGCTSSATSLACDYDPCRGSTGFSATGAAGFSQVGGTDYQNNDPIGPANCTGGPQWNTTSITLTAGNTYALMVQNYTGSTGGVTVSSGGTALFGPQAAFTVTNQCGTDNTVDVAATNVYTQAGWNYSWNWGDGNTTSGTTSTSHTYATIGTYTISLTITDPLGCTQTALASTVCTLPIELLSFDGNYDGSKVKLTWTTATETDNDFFTLERSFDGKVFEIIGTVDGAGNSVIPISYRFDDERPVQGLTYYRLKQTDFNGKFVYTDPLAVYIDDETGNIAVYPNPAKESLNVFFTASSNEETHLKITDITGKTVYRTSLMPSGKTLDHKINSSDFPKGIYFVTVVQGNKLYHTKFSVE